MSDVKQAEPFYNYCLTDIKGEIWKDVINWDGCYQISNMGRIKSLARYSSDGRWIKEKILKQNLSNDVTVKFAQGIRESINVLNLVGSHFIGDKPDGYVYSRNDKNKINNRASNISIITNSQHMKLCYDTNVHPVGITNPNGNAEYLYDFNLKNRKDYEEKYLRFENGILSGIICIRCGIEKSINDYYIRKRKTHDSRHLEYKECTCVKIKERYHLKHNYKK